MRDECIHIAKSDNKFTGRMRFHQSWYREQLGLEPGPNPASGGQLYGNMLTPDDGRAGKNFLSGEIAAVAKNRLDRNEGALEPYRLLHNLLNSQPMCFNLFGPLVNDHNLVAKFLHALPPFTQADDLAVTRVEIEFAPPAAEHLDDRTAFDAFIEYTHGGKRGFVGIETKLTEPFSQASYGHATRRYPLWLKKADRWWRPDVDKQFDNPKFNQLWRNHMAFAMNRRDDDPYDEAYCAVVYHERDEGFPASLGEYRKNLTDAAQTTLLEWPLGDLVGRWLAVAPESRHGWLEEFKLRYLDLERSEAAYHTFRGH